MYIITFAFVVKNLFFLFIFTIFNSYYFFIQIDQSLSTTQKPYLKTLENLHANSMVTKMLIDKSPTINGNNSPFYFKLHFLIFPSNIQPIFYLIFPKPDKLKQKLEKFPSKDHRIVNEGNYFLLYCFIKGKDKTRIWFKDFSSTLPKHVVVRENLLIVHNAKIEDNGLYICVSHFNSTNGIVDEIITATNVSIVAKDLNTKTTNNRLSSSSTEKNLNAETTTEHLLTFSTDASDISDASIVTEQHIPDENTNTRKHFKSHFRIKKKVTSAVYMLIILNFYLNRCRQ